MANPDPSGGLSTAREAEIRQFLADECVLCLKDAEDLFAALAALRQERDDHRTTSLNLAELVNLRERQRDEARQERDALQQALSSSIDVLASRDDRAEAAEASRARLIAAFEQLPRLSAASGISDGEDWVVV